MEQNERKKLTIPVLIKIIKETIQGIGEDRVVVEVNLLIWATAYALTPSSTLILIN